MQNLRQKILIKNEVETRFIYLAETHSGSKPKNLVGAVEDFEVCSSLLFFDVHSQLVAELV